MHRAVLASILLLVLGASQALFAADWPQYRGPQATGISPEKGLNTDWAARTPRMLWRVPLTDNGYAGPSVAEHKVFIIDHQGKQDIIRALSLADGTEVWRYAYDDAPNENYGYAHSTPTYHEGMVYTISALGMVHCLEAKTGNVIWSRNVVKDFNGRLPGWRMAPSPVIDGNKVILCPGGENAAVIALNTKTGGTIWQGGGSDVAGYATPVVATIDGKKQYVVFTGKNLIGVDAGNGMLLWRFPWVTGSDVNAATPVVMGNAVFITSSYNHGCALVEIVDGQPVKKWENRAMMAHFNGPILYNGYLYGITDPGPGNLVCINPATGETVWKQPGFEKGGVMGVDGMLIAQCGSNGDLYLVKLTPEKYTELGKLPTGAGQSWTAPILSDGKLIIRNKTFLVCLDVK